MNTMNMPGFTAEASLYHTNNHYRFAAGGSFLSDGNTTVTPQGCGIIEFAECALYVGTVSLVCGAFCAAAAALGPPGWAACFSCVVGAGGLGTLVSCHDCLPGPIRDVIDLARSQDGGDGGPPPPPPCCPANRPICCGSCASGICDDACIRRGQSCP